MSSPFQKNLTIPPLNIKLVNFIIVGDTELIVHAWSEKARRMMQERQAKGKPIKEARDPEADFQAALYEYPGGGYGFPAPSIKQSLRSVAHKDMGFPKNLVDKSLFVLGKTGKIGVPLVKIHGSNPVMRTDMVRNATGVADIRYRPSFFPWYINFTLKFNADLLNDEAITNLIEQAGFGAGIGEWRPENGGGEYGQFHLARAGEIPESAQVAEVA